MKLPAIHRGMSQRAAIKAANDLGATVAMVKRAEYGFSHPLMKKRIVTSHGRKDAALKLVLWLEKLATIRDAAGAQP